MNKIKLAKFSNEFDVPQHLNLGNGSLFFLLREKGSIMLIVDWKKKNLLEYFCAGLIIYHFPFMKKVWSLTINISGSIFKFILEFRN